MIQRISYNHSYDGHYCVLKAINLLFLFFFTCCSAAFSQEGLKVDISLTGLQEEMQRNVLAHLSIARQKDNPSLTDYLVKRLSKKAEKEIVSALEPFGYYQPEVDLDLLKEGSIWRVKLDVNPGNPVIIADVTLKLSGSGSNERQLIDAVDEFPLIKGDILDHQRYESGKENLISQAGTSGYMDAKFSEHKIIVDREKQAARIFLILDTGPLYLFGETTFAADFLSHGLLTRMLPYKEGDPFSSKALVRLRQSLYSTDYFSNVDVSSGEVQKDTFSVPVKVALTAKNPNKYGFGVGYGTDTGFRGTVEWTRRLLNRYGHQFKLTLQPSERQSFFGGVYTIPVKDPRKDRLAFLAKWQKDNFESTETEQRSVSVSYDHIREAGEYSIYFRFLDEDFDSGIETGHATLFIPGLKTTIRLADDRLVTKRGFRTTFNLAGAHKNVLSDASFLQASLAAKGIYSFLENWRIIGRFQLGGTVVDDIGDLPPSLRFYAGGDQSVRGYAYKSIGPRDSYGNVLGGQYFVTYSVELEKKLFDNWSAALFFDSGDALNSLNDLAMKSGAGIGLRWNAPFGQVRLDIANALSEGGDSWRIHFNVGADL